MSVSAKLRCAIYTRKSTEEGLEQEFNSLDAQRDACEAFISSQASLGWKLVADRYDDGGISGGTIERPALQRLLQDIRDRKVEVVVVYKIDRLTRSLMDFSRIVEVFDGHSVSFVSVTQQFNTTTSMGRLTLNVLLSFAQFEREVAAERIRDKVAASRRKGIWMGGSVPLGYRVENRKLIIDAETAPLVRSIFARYLELRSVPRLVKDLNGDGAGERLERPDHQRWTKGSLYYLLSNPTYIGKARHKAAVYEGEHQPIIEEALFNEVQRFLKQGVPARRASTNAKGGHWLTGMLFDETGQRMKPVFTTNHGRRYRYYVGPDNNEASKPAWRLPANQLEGAVKDGLKAFLCNGPQIASALDGLANLSRMSAATAKTRELAAERAEFNSLARRLVCKVTLAPHALSIAIDRSILAAVCCGEVPAPSDDDSVPHFELSVPMRMRRRGVEARILIEGSQTASPDVQLVELIGRAHLILNRLTNGDHKTFAQVAEAAGLHIADVSRILPLAFLSPSLAEKIITGQHPPALTARALSRHENLPHLWSHQPSFLGI